MLRGKSAVITGSTSGIGLAIARKLAAKGVNIMLNGFGDADEIEQVRSSLSQDCEVEVHYNGADMTKPAEIRGLIAATAEKLGSLDILVNNVGAQFVNDIETYPDEEWERVRFLCLDTVFHGTKAAIPHMKKNKWGRIINTASAHGLVASPYKSAYVAAKHGILGFTKCAAMELAGDGITVNAICPGYVWTPHVERQMEDTKRMYDMDEQDVKEKVMLKGHAIKEFIQPEEVGALAAFLASEDAKNITGSAQVIDGGWTAN